MKEIILKGKNITKIYGENTVLNHIDIDVFSRDFTVIMGSSGSGKSTLLHCLSGMDKPSEGEVIYKDMDIRAGTEKQLTDIRARDFGFVFQKTHLISNLTLNENIVIAGLIGGKSDSRARETADDLITKVNLKNAADRLPRQVSGGEAQRAAVARAVINSPALLFADEPTGALNRANSDDIMDILSALNKNGQTILLVTHDRQAALRGNRILYLEDGSVTGEITLPEYNGPDADREAKLSRWLKDMRW